LSAPKNFRESRYLNESGTKTGNWFLNRLDYFQFHEYPEYKKHKLICVLATILFYGLTIKFIMISFLSSLPFFYASYIASKSLYVLHTKVCRHNGYFLYPSKIVKFFKVREIETDLNDFDSIATMSKK
jgi:hypothetical protein